MAGLASIGVKIGYKSSNEDPTYTDLPHLQETPELGGDAEKIDVTCLSDTVRQYVAGVKDYGDLDFVFLYDASEENSSFKMLKAVEGEKKQYQVSMPDGASFEFAAIVNLKMGAAQVNEALTFTASFALQSDVEFTEAD